MPIFAFECPVCGSTEDHLVRVGDTGAEPYHCNVPMRRLLSAPAFKFKGTRLSEQMAARASIRKEQQRD